MISTKKCTVKEASNESRKLFYYPRLTNIYPVNYEYENFIAQINEEILQDVLAFKDLVSNYNEVDYYAYTDYKVSIKKRQLISILLQSSEIIGTQIVTYINTYNYDVSKNKRIGLNDIFKKDTNYLQIISNEVENKLNEVISKLESTYIELYFEDYNDFIQIYENQTFYIQSDKIVLCFSSYELGMGFPRPIKISIKFKDYKEYLTDYTIKEIWEGE